nr:slipin family protein [Streptomyces aureus]
MVQELIVAITAACSASVVYVAAGAKVVKQYERGVVFRLGRVAGEVRSPGFTMVVPFVDRMRKVNMQIVTLPIPAQEGITRDNVTVRVDAVVYFKVVDATNAIIQVEDYRFAVSQMAQTSLRSIIGKSDLDDLLSNREKLNQGLELMIDSPAIGWGVQIDRVEIKDVSLPESMKRSMARQAEADRERRARVINADAELQASKKLAEAAGVMSEQPAALQLRLLQTVVPGSTPSNLPSPRSGSAGRWARSVSRSRSPTRTGSASRTRSGSWVSPGCRWNRRDRRSPRARRSSGTARTGLRTRRNTRSRRRPRGEARRGRRGARGYPCIRAEHPWGDTRPAQRNSRAQRGNRPLACPP